MNLVVPGSVKQLPSVRKPLNRVYVITYSVSFTYLTPVVQTLDSAIHWINHYPLDNSIGFASVYPLDSDLSGGQRYPSIEQLGPELKAV